MRKARSRWTPQRDGWQKGGYRIEGVGPQLWVLTHGKRTGSGIPKVLATAASVKALQGIADRHGRRLQRQRRLRLHAASAVAALAGIAFAMELSPPFMVLTTVGLLAWGLRSLAIVVMASTEAAGLRIRHTYQ